MRHAVRAHRRVQFLEEGHADLGKTSWDEDAASLASPSFAERPWMSAGTEVEFRFTGPAPRANNEWLIGPAVANGADKLTG